ncbi:MAG: hypothetical protein WAP51_04620, partial [Candidatus Sungiibacteriota bacterium]
FIINFTNALGTAFLKALESKTCILPGTDLQCGISDRLLAFTNVQVSTTQPLNTEQAKCEVITHPILYESCLKSKSRATSFAEFQAAGADKKIEAAIYQALWLIIIIPILSFVFFAAAIFFLSRYLMLSILLVFAPIVFLFMILPDTRGLWSKWWNNLVKWSFFAPAFLFLLFLTVTTFGELTIANVGQGANVKGFFGIGFDMILIIALMVMNLLIAQQMGISGASMVTGWGNRAAGWVGRQAKGAAYRGAIRGAEPVAKAVTESRVGRFLAETPGLRGLTRPALAIQEQREKLDADRAKQIERAAAVSPDLALARFKGESMGVKAAYAKSANPENMRKLMSKMNPTEQESFVADLHANRAKYRIDESELAKKIGGAMAKDARGLDLRVMAKTGTRTSDANFQDEVNKYLDGLTDNELQDAFNAKTISENPHAVDYIVRNFKNDRRMGNAILGTPEKIKSFAKLAEAAAEQTSDYQIVKAQLPERQKTRVHLEYLRSAMEKEGNAEGAKALRYSPMINVISGAGVRPFVTEKTKGVAAEPAMRPPPTPPPAAASQPPAPPTPPPPTPPPGAGAAKVAEARRQEQARKEGEETERINKERIEQSRKQQQKFEEERQRGAQERARQQKEEDEKRRKEKRQRRTEERLRRQPPPAGPPPPPQRPPAPPF